MMEGVHTCYKITYRDPVDGEWRDYATEIEQKDAFDRADYWQRLTGMRVMVLKQWEQVVWDSLVPGDR